ncbi:MAG TPA: universal stress protein, partial [Solirubrobacteraceae bacterium]
MTDVILCAVDDSEAAQGVLDTARSLAQGLQTSLVVIHVVGDGSDDADELVGRVRDRLGDEHADVRVAAGSPAEAIRAAADGEDAEMLVVGSRGRGNLRSAVLGSVSRDLTANAGRPVVVVPPGGAWSTDDGRAATEGASVVCGVDGSEQALAGAVFAGRLAERLYSRLVIVHARQNVRAALSYPGARSETPPVTGQADSVDKVAAEVLERAVRAADVGATGVTEPGPPAEILESVAEREQARLIVITARGLGGVRASVLGSVAAELTAGAGRPVVVLSEA